MVPSYWSTLALSLWLLVAGGCQEVPAQDSGGPLSSEQAAYDVTFYDLDVRVDPGQKRIEGTLQVRADVLDSLDVVVLNLDRRLSIDEVWPSDAPNKRLTVDRRDDANQVWIDLPARLGPGDDVALTVAYGGHPRVAPNPPWDGGLTWATTPSGAPWVATSCQTAGADLWWPVKDHPSDEPDSMRIGITVPDSLVAASNGRLAGVEQTTDSTRTYEWAVSSSINTYGVTMNVGPYVRVDTTYGSTANVDVPVSFYALPSDSGAARAILSHFLDHVRFLEETLGAYPFRGDKYGLAQTPFLGMEHQTLIAYGNGFDRTGGLGYDAGFDALHFHELAHEWYGNCVTVRDWKDFWLHEGTATYLEALYAESLRGPSAYHEVIAHHRRQISNQAPIAKKGPATAQEMYHRDVYFKGALILHTLRSMIGKEGVTAVLRRFLSSGSTDAPSCRHVDTEGFLSVAESVADQSLDGVFETYLYQASLPRIDSTRTDEALVLEWTNTQTSEFDVPIPVEVNGETTDVAMSGGRGRLPIPESGADVRIDPEGWVLRAR